MSEPVRLSLAEAEALACAALVASRTSPENARPTARALVAAEADGQAGHGLSRVPSYAMQSRAGKVDGRATPVVERVAGATLRVDGGFGFAYPAIDRAIEVLAPLVREHGIGLAAVHRSHHFGQAGAHAERLAASGLVAIVLGNSPKAMAFWGGRKAMLGTNPLAFAAPLPGGADPLVIDLAMSVAARGKIVAAEKAGKPIPADWAVDATGQPTTDPKSALAGTLLPIGGAKGGALALMIEILAAAVTGSAFGWEASSFFDAEGGPPNMGHVIIAIDAARSSAGAFDARMATLLEAIAAEPGARLPGTRRLANRARASAEGLAIPAALHAEICTLIERPA
ncbi:MAG: (2R)-3-sulfolactate dehydrogenase [Pseudomonadota bacterium]|jgi:(2R)-3-sulfolactate dehydrogenase (NADP+)|nr:(2R)-3-sulfolactate dehydrogenase [Pseudomonadota bacterium]MDQ1309407.1 (2R)-3-sulfolactate dehydrogenase [Pseudomonadota bacterium]MDQ1342749.1 (2R)-3-sulfolactate dehydrogenase [Pseudomonadota bacterium]